MDTGKILKRFDVLNDFIQGATEAQCLELARAEEMGQNRISLLLRIYSRFNKMRRARETAALRGRQKFDVSIERLENEKV
jgi:hypothetical protein